MAHPRRSLVVLPIALALAPLPAVASEPAPRPSALAATAAPPALTRLTIRVVGENGIGLGGVLVQVRPVTGGFASSNVRTGPDGTATVGRDPRVYRVTPVVAAPEPVDRSFSPATTDVDLADGPATVTFEVDSPVAVLAGSLTGIPEPAAFRVRLVRTDGRRSLTVTTDAAGTFAAGVEPGRWAATVLGPVATTPPWPRPPATWSPPVIETDVVGSTAAVSLAYVMGTVAGTVTYADGSPAAGVTVRLTRPDATVSPTVATGVDGSYSVPAEPGAWTVQVLEGATRLPTDLSEIAVTVPATGGTAVAPVRLAGPVTVRLTGTVRTADGSPFAGVAVAITRLGGSGALAVPVTGTDGRYVAELPPGRYWVNPTTGHFLPAARTVDLRFADASADFDRDPLNHVTGQVREPGGDPVAGVTVYAVPEAGGEAIAAFDTRHDGTFSLRVPAGRYWVVPVGASFAPPQRLVDAHTDAVTAGFVLADP